MLGNTLLSAALNELFIFDKASKKILTRDGINFLVGIKA